MDKFLVLILISFLSGCASLDSSPPKYIYEAWEKSDVQYPDVKEDMQSCGYKDIILANDISKKEILLAESCMKEKGYVLNRSSYRANNCYGSNSPYLCNDLWGGQKPKSRTIRSQLE